MAVINPLCSTNFPHLVSEGVGAAATAYEKVKERTYSDLDFSKYELIPFIIEATGGLGRAAHGFCKELKSRRESFNCCNSSDEERVWKFSDPLIVALNVELQKINSRMLLERAPHTGNLIASEVDKCKQSVVIKRDKAIESLLSEAVQPRRIMTRTEVGQSWTKSPISTKKMLNVDKPSTRIGPLQHDNDPNPMLKVPSKQYGIMLQRPLVKLSIPTPPPDPDPPDGNKDATDKSIESLTSRLEERNLALETHKSQLTSTSETHGRNCEMIMKDLREMSWEPPGLQAESGNNNETGWQKAGVPVPKTYNN